MFKMKKYSVMLMLALTFLASGINAEEKTGRLESDLTRDERSKPLQIIDFAGVTEGNHVLDILGGGGYYTHLLSQAVGPKGSVTLHNNAAYLPYVGKELESRFANNQFTNVERLMSEVDDLKLGTAKFDIAFFVLGYHDLYYQGDKWDVTADKLIPQLKASLKDDGMLLVVDHRAEAGTGKSSAQTLHRITPEFVIEDLKNRGFDLVKTSDILANGKDPLNIIAFDKSLKRNTSRFVLLFKKN